MDKDAFLQMKWVLAKLYRFEIIHTTDLLGKFSHSSIEFLNKALVPKVIYYCFRYSYLYSRTVGIMNCIMGMCGKLAAILSLKNSGKNLVTSVEKRRNSNPYIKF